MEEKNQAKVKAAKARARSLTPEQRTEIARKAAVARHNIPTADYVGDLKIGDLTISCAVLPNGDRVISRGSITSAFGPVTGGYQQRKRRKSPNKHDGEMPLFLVAESLQPYIDGDLRTVVSRAFRYKDPRGGPIREGIDASLIPRVCDVWLKAREANALTKIQIPVADRAELLMRGLAHSGIIALVDEATGYQEIRRKDELQQILSAYIAPSLLPWSKRFPMDFYQEMFRLWGWNWNPIEYMKKGPRGPRYAGKLTKILIYDQLPEIVLEELERKNPPNAKWQRKNKQFQYLSEDIGNPHVEKLVAIVTTLFRISPNKDIFWDNYARAFPGKNVQQELDVGSDDIPAIASPSALLPPS